MNIKLSEMYRENDEVFFDIIDKESETKVGILFTIQNHIAYEIYPKYRGYGAATEALKKITAEIHRPVLEITSNNIASKSVALKAGYKLVRINEMLEIYEYVGTQNNHSA